jgi:hypothetical protein
MVQTSAKKSDLLDKSKTESVDLTGNQNKDELKKKSENYEMMESEIDEKIEEILVEEVL